VEKAALPLGVIITILTATRGVNWEQGHVFFQQRFWRFGKSTQWYPNNDIADLGLRTLGNAGWNLMPMPRFLNRFLGRHQWAQFGVGVGTAASIPGSFYGGYKLGQYLQE